MAKNKNRPKETVAPKPTRRFNLGGARRLFSDRRLHLSVGLLLMVVALFLLVAFVSYLFTGAADQSVVESWRETGVRPAGDEVSNWLGFLGAWSAHRLVYHWLGLGAFFLLPICFLLGYRLVFQRDPYPLARLTNLCLFAALWLSILLGAMLLTAGASARLTFLAGGIGFEWSSLLLQLTGWGTFLVLAFFLTVFVIYFFDVRHLMPPALRTPRAAAPPARPVSIDVPISNDFEAAFEAEAREPGAVIVETPPPPPTMPAAEETPVEDELELAIEPRREEEVIDEADEELALEVGAGVNEAVGRQDQAHYDPTLELSQFRFPPLDLLRAHGQEHVAPDEEELKANKNRIVTTLSNYNIGIASIKATIGPTVTLYEIVPEAGVRISKIKNLEDDVALSLSALGIRIIAPIPGKGTIGIEVPNKNREIVSARSVISTEKFLRSRAELPVVLGKTITNEVFVKDLAKMPHLLMAGATGQGKSVGLNILLTSLIYKKHPSQLKFVLVDPKKVELSLF
ncbi:MAG: DNA translocase FtsK 4TM domain-containing protein, partial [Catalinimonas sp.]